MNTATIEPSVLPLAFIPNAGQYPTGVKFQVQGKDSQLQFLQDEVVLHLSSDSAVRLTWVGANPTPPVEGNRLLPGVVNIIRGNDPAAWLTKIPMMPGKASIKSPTSDCFRHLAQYRTQHGAIKES